MAAAMSDENADVLRRRRERVLAEYRRVQREYADARRTSDRDAMEGANMRAAELSAELHSVDLEIRRVAGEAS